MDSMEKTDDGKAQILFVDDDEAVREIGKKMLEKSGYLVVVANDGVEAMQIIHSHPQAFDLVITDYDMPFMNGKELTRQLFSLRPDLRVIISTGGWLITKEELQAWGVSALLEKPYTQKELEYVVQKEIAHTGITKVDAHGASVSNG